MRRLPMLGAEGAPVGYLAVASTAGLAAAPDDVAMLRIFATCAAGELFLLDSSRGAGPRLRAAIPLAPWRDAREPLLEFGHCRRATVAVARVDDR